MKKAFLTGLTGNVEEYEKAVMLLQEHGYSAIHEHSIYENTDVQTMSPDVAAELRKKALYTCELLVLMPGFQNNPLCKIDIENASKRSIKMKSLEQFYILTNK